MNQNTIRGMEPHIRQRFHFAASSFSRIYGVNHVTLDMIDFCYDWAFTEETSYRLFFTIILKKDGLCNRPTRSLHARHLLFV